MKKLMVCVLVLFSMVAFTAQAPALNIFKQTFIQKYNLDEPRTPAQARLAEAVRVQKCNLCHVPDKDKEFRNNYGQTLEEYLNARDYSRTRIQEEPRKVNDEILQALLKAEQGKSPTGETHGERILKGLLP